MLMSIPGGEGRDGDGDLNLGNAESVTRILLSQSLSNILMPFKYAQVHQKSLRRAYSV